MFLQGLPADAIAPIRARVLVALRDREQRLRDAPSALAQSPDSVAEDLHKIRGVAPMLDLPDLGALAAEAEDRLDAWLGTMRHGQDRPVPEDLLACLRALGAAMTKALDDA